MTLPNDFTVVQCHLPPRNNQSYGFEPSHLCVHGGHGSLHPYQFPSGKSMTISPMPNPDPS